MNWSRSWSRSRSRSNRVVVQAAATFASASASAAAAEGSGSRRATHSARREQVMKLRRQGVDAASAIVPTPFTKVEYEYELTLCGMPRSLARVTAINKGRIEIINKARDGRNGSVQLDFPSVQYLADPSGENEVAARPPRVGRPASSGHGSSRTKVARVRPAGGVQSVQSVSSGTSGNTAIQNAIATYARARHPPIRGAQTRGRGAVGRPRAGIM